MAKGDWFKPTKRLKYAQNLQSPRHARNHVVRTTTPLASTLRPPEYSPLSRSDGPHTGKPHVVDQNNDPPEAIHDTIADTLNAHFVLHLQSEGSRAVA